MTNAEIQVLYSDLKNDNRVGKNGDALFTLQTLIVDNAAKVAYDLAHNLDPIQVIFATDPVSGGAPIDPAPTVDGYRFLNSTTTGAYGGYTFTAGNIYTYDLTGTTWVETVPVVGDTMVNEDNSKTYLHNGTAWVISID